MALICIVIYCKQETCEFFKTLNCPKNFDFVRVEGKFLTHICNVEGRKRPENIIKAQANYNLTHKRIQFFDDL